MSGIVVKAKGSRLQTYEIIDVRKESVADLAGIKSGDEIITINYHIARDVDINYIYGLFNSRENKKVRLELRRDGQRFTKVFRLKKQI